MKSYIYILGRTPDLAFLELQTFLPDVTRITSEVAQSGALVPIEKLGGTVKIAEVADAPVIAEKSTFGISVYGGPQIANQELDQMKKQFHAARFVVAKGGPLSSVVVAKNKLQEIIVVKLGEKSIFAKTIQVQDFESWNSRDFGRPYADPSAGMLPPKVSRMVVNIAGVGSGKTLLDPFCGMGTILSEALLMGWNVVGSDQSAEVIEKARGNLRWLMQEYKLGVTYRLTTSDAVHISEHLDGALVDAIVTEPFMGSTTVKDPKNTIKGLEKLYIGCLREWHGVLKPNGVIMIALPKYEIKGKLYFVKKVVDNCEKLGYTIKAGPIEYGRPGAIVKRVFYLFQKN